MDVSAWSRLICSDGSIIVSRRIYLKIVLAASSYLPVLGGLQEAVSQIACELKTAGHAVVVVANRYPRKLNSAEMINGVSVKRVLFPELHITSLNPRRILKYVLGLFIAPVNFFRLLMLLSKLRPDVVNIHFLGSQAPYALLAAKVLGIKCIVSLHGDDIEGLPHRTKANLCLFRKVLSGADHVTACSQYLLNEAEKLAPEIRGKSSAIPNGIRQEEFENALPYKHGRTYIFAGGRLVYKKGFDILLKAYQIAVRRGLTADLILAGDGPEKKKLMDIATNMELPFLEKGKEINSVDGTIGMRRHLIFWGRADRQDMKSLLKGCEVFVIPSRREPFGIVALEALAAGKKIVASRVGGLPEIVHEGHGNIFVTPEDSEALAAAIMQTLHYKADTTMSKMNGLSWSTVATRYLDTFKGPGQA